MNKLISVLLTGVLTVVSVNASAKTFKLATNVRHDGPPGLLLQEFAKNVKEQTHDRVDIKIFANGTLGSQNQYLQLIQDDVVDMGLVNSATMESIEPSFGVLNLPYIFRTFDEFKYVMQSDYINNELFSMTKPFGFEIVGFLDTGARSLFSTKPIRSIEDLDGLKIRTMPSQTYIKMLELLGASPTPLDFTAIYPALQQGLIDGAEGGLGTLWSKKFGDSAKYAVKTEQTRMVDLIVINNNAMSELSTKDVDIIKAEMKAISNKSFDAIKTSANESMRLASEKLGVSFSEIDKQPLINAMKPLYVKALNDEKKSHVIKRVFELEKRSL